MNDNPYESPVGDPLDSRHIASKQVNWKSIARRWEVLRIPYNAVLCLAGLAAAVMNMSMPVEELIAGAIMYAVAVNLCYFAGPMVEMYSNWLIDVGEHRFVPSLVVRFVRSQTWVTVLLFVCGLLLSVLVTLALGTALAFQV